MRALLVDDSKAMRTILKRIVLSLGYDVVEAGDGVEGLQRLREANDIALALVDWNMPEMNGLEFVRAVRADHKYAGVGICMVSAENDMGKIARALMLGADEYAMKPVTREIIVEKLALMGIFAL